MSKISFDCRLMCKHSYADESEHLLCGLGGICDGTVYDDCQPDKCYYNREVICAYPIDSCHECPANPYRKVKYEV